MEVYLKLVECHFKDDNGKDTTYYRLEYYIDEENKISLPIKKTEAMLILLNEHNR